MTAIDNSFSGWSISKKNSPLIPLSQMNRNLVGRSSYKIFYGMSPIRLPHFIPIGQKNMIAMSNSCFWLAEILKILSCHGQLLFLIGWNLDNLMWNYEAWWIVTCMNDVWKILYKITIFRSDHATNMTAIGSSCLRLAN